MSIRTEQVNLTVKGPWRSVVAWSQGDDREQSSVKVACDGGFELTICDSCVGERASSAHGGSILEVQTEPLFFEQSSYEVVIESRTAEAISFWHDNPQLREAISPIGLNGNLLTGTLNFRNEIGLSDLVVCVAGKRHLTLTIEVYPLKIGYRDDYQALIADVTREVYNLAFDFLKRTYQGYDLGDGCRPSPTEFFSVIQTIYNEMIRATKAIAKSPHHELRLAHEVMPAHKAKHVDVRGMRWLQGHPGHASVEDGRIRADRVLATRKRTTFDTNENRLVKHIVQSALQRLKSFRSLYCEKAGKSTDRALIEQIDEMVYGLGRCASDEYLRNVGASGAAPSMSLVFGMAPGYRELYRCHLMLQRGLSIQGDLFNIGIKDLAQLYEYWCFLKLNAIMRDRYQLVSQDIVKVKGDGLQVQLVKGAASRVRYRDELGGDEICLTYNPSSVAAPTVSQKPDNVLSLVKRNRGSERNRYEYVFDAKYRLDMAEPGTPYRSKYGAPGPKEEDINTMHRYRDAIVCSSGNEGCGQRERTMFGAYVLFPYRDEDEYRDHRLYKSIGEVNIGGLPFLPSSTHLVTDLIDELVGMSSESAFEQVPLARGTRERFLQIDWGDRDVLVGLVRRREQLGACLEHGFYYVPCNRVSVEAFPLRRVALYQPKTVFGVQAGIRYVGDVATCEVVRRCDIKELPSDKVELCYRFNVTGWQSLKTPIAVGGQGLRGSHEYTNRFLLENARLFHELRFRNETEWRLYQELSRLGEGIECDIPTLDTMLMIRKSVSVELRGGAIVVGKDGTTVTSQSFDDFGKNPRVLIRQIVALM